MEERNTTIGSSIHLARLTTQCTRRAWAVPHGRHPVYLSFTIPSQQDFANGRIEVDLKNVSAENPIDSGARQALAPATRRLVQSNFEQGCLEVEATNSMIDSPYEHCHSAFTDQREYELLRAVLDTGDDENDSSVTLIFRHKISARRRIFRFTGVGFAHGSSAMMTGIRGFLPVYVASLGGRQFENGQQIEVGDSDPGSEWFWAQSITEIEGVSLVKPCPS